MLRNKLLILSLILVISFPVFGEDKFAPGKIFVKFKAGIVSPKQSGATASYPINSIMVNSATVNSLNAKYSVLSVKPLAQKGVQATKVISGNIVILPDLSDIYLIELSKEANVMAAVNDYRNDPGVEFASPNYIRKLFATPQDPDFNESPESYPNQWGLVNIGLKHIVDGSSGWDIEKGTNEVKVAIIDTGVNYKHTDLLDRLNTLEGRCFISGYPSTDVLDDHGHGSHVAGIIGAKTDNAGDVNGRGVAGVDWYCRIVPIKVFDSNGEGTDEDIISALQWAVSIEADVISMSFGGYSPNDALAAAISLAATSDCVLVAAAGNEDTTAYAYPAAYPSVIAVAALGPNDVKASYSNHAWWIDVAAPGGEFRSGSGADAAKYMIYSTYAPVTYGVGEAANNKYTSMAGTSMAAPFVSGVAALLRAKNRTMTAEAISNLIKTYTDQVDAINPNYAGQIGTGRVNAFAALGGLSGYLATPGRGYSAYGVVQIMGNATGEGFTKYRVEVGDGTSPSSWTTLEERSGVTVLHSTLASLDTTGKDGYMTLRLVINDLATTETRLTFIAGSQTWPILFGHAMYGPNPFDPRKGSTMIKYTLTRNSDTHITFYNITGTLICRKFYQWGQEGGKQGDNRVFWDGKDDFGQEVANGIYMFQIISEERKIGSGKIAVLKNR